MAANRRGDFATLTHRGRQKKKVRRWRQRVKIFGKTISFFRK